VLEQVAGKTSVVNTDWFCDDAAAGYLQRSHHAELVLIARRELTESLG